MAISCTYSWSRDMTRAGARRDVDKERAASQVDRCMGVNCEAMCEVSNAERRLLWHGRRQQMTTLVTAGESDQSGSRAGGVPAAEIAFRAGRRWRIYRAGNVDVTRWIRELLPLTDLAHVTQCPFLASKSTTLQPGHRLCPQLSLKSPPKAFSTTMAPAWASAS